MTNLRGYHKSKLSRHFEDIHLMPAIVLLAVARQGLHPYIDPGTGSIVLQAVIGGLVAGLVALKMFWNQIKSFFRKLLHIGTRSVERQDSPK